MGMRRLRIIGTAICLAMIGAILPMIASLYYAWLLAFQEESNVLYEYSMRMLSRAKYTLNETRKVLSILEEPKNNFSICSQDHIKHMEEASSVILESKKISYFKNDIEFCNSCGFSESKSPRSKIHFILPDGLKIGVAIDKPNNPHSVFIPVRKSGNYDVLIDSKRFSDIITPDEVWLAILYDGKIITERKKIHSPLYQKILSKIKEENLEKYYQTINGELRLKPADSLKKNQVFILDGRMIYMSQYGPFYFISSEPETVVKDHYKQFQLILLPLGLITAFFIIGLVTYFSKKQLLFKSEIQEALSNNEFYLCYQPIVNTLSGICCGAEALIRWKKPNGQMIKPDFFIPYAEEENLIGSITRRVIELMFNDMEQFLSENAKAHISINVSCEDICQGDIFEILESKIMASKVSRKQIWIELTERTFLKMEEIQKVLTQAQTLGYVVVVDDFGTGFSNLSYLQNLPLDMIKIDKSFIDSLCLDSATSNVADYIIEMSKNINLKIVAEGVEQTYQYQYLKEKKVDYLQGYLFSKPISSEEFITFFTKMSKNA